jgi:hypothetical protein
MVILQILVIALVSMVLWAFPYGLLLGAVIQAAARAALFWWSSRTAEARATA